MEAAGYAFGPVVIPAAGFGAPHARHRIFFVADANMPEPNSRRAPSGKQPLRDIDRAFGFLADDDDDSGLQRHREPRRQHDPQERGDPNDKAGLRGFWSEADWLECSDGAFRPVEPGTFPLAHGVAKRMGKLRAYGNAIVAPVAAAFIEATL
jgi:DNA (cytosine-5)-methyltransferase 1